MGEYEYEESFTLLKNYGQNSLISGGGGGVEEGYIHAGLINMNYNYNSSLAVITVPV